MVRKDNVECVYGVVRWSGGELDFDAAYRVRVRGLDGVAFRLLGWEPRWEPNTALMIDEDGQEYEQETGESEWVPNVGGRVVAVMVGDDRRHLVDPDDLIPLDRRDYCGECGQVGCTHDGYDRSEDD